MYVGFGLGHNRHRWARGGAGGGALTGMLMLAVGASVLLKDAPRYHHERPAPAVQQQEKGLEFLDGTHRTRTVTRVGADGQTYQIKVVDDGRAHPEPIDPLMPSLAVGFGIALMGFSGAAFMVFGGRDEADEAPAPPPPSSAAPSAWGEGSPVVFSDEDVLREMQKAEQERRG